jgi:hypothetical protein
MKTACVKRAFFYKDYIRRNYFSACSNADFRAAGAQFSAKIQSFFSRGGNLGIRDKKMYYFGGLCVRFNLSGCC